MDTIKIQREIESLVSELISEIDNSPVVQALEKDNDSLREELDTAHNTILDLEMELYQIKDELKKQEIVNNYSTF